MKMLLIILLLIAGLYAQDVEMPDDEEGDSAQVEVKCEPDDLSVPYDNFAGTATSIMDIKLWYSYGYEHYKNKNYSAALPYLWKVYENDSSKYGERAIGRIAAAYFYEQKYDSTLLVCYKGLKRFPKNQKLHYYAGFLQQKLFHEKCAIPHYLAMIEKSPKNKIYLETLALLYFKTDDKKAIEYQQKVVDYFPDDAKAAETLGLYMQALLGSAKEAWKNAWEKDKTNLKAGRNYVKALIDEGEYKKALPPLNKIIKQGAEPIDYKNRAVAYENLSQFKKALRDLKIWRKIEPDNIEIYLFLADDYAALNLFSTANNWISKALRKKPGYGKAYIARGELYEATISYCESKRKSNKLEMEDKMVYEKAREQYKKAMKDFTVKAKAKSKYRALASFVRTKQDKFMQPDAKIKSTCYSYIK